MATFLAEVGTTLESVLGWLGKFVDAIFTAEGALAPLFGFITIAISVSVIMLGIKICRSFCWGW